MELWEALLALDGAMEWYNRQAQLMWETARMASFYNVLPHTKKNKLKKFSDIIEFEWDKKAQRLTNAEALSLLRDIKARDNKKPLEVKKTTSNGNYN
ncbi:MAG: hypothetical protein ACPGFK_00645 [Flavobacteriaceae bacterium]